MNKLLISILFSMTSLIASSQKVYFVYLQSEADQPFFVKMNEKINSSTGSGYLILSKLHDSSYNFSIGFPQNKWPEQNFSISVDKRDHGYLLKNFGEKGWGLFDLQTLAIQMSLPGNVKTDVAVKTENKNVSAFTDILSKAADDPSLKEKPDAPIVEEKKTEVIIQPVEKKDLSATAIKPKVEVKEPVVIKPVEAMEKPVVKKDLSAVAENPKVEIKETVIKPAEEQKIISKDTAETKPTEVALQTVLTKEEPIVGIKEPIEIKPAVTNEQLVIKEETKTVADEEFKKSIVTKKSESSTTEGFGLVFLDDHQNGHQDTIRLIIPNPKPVVVVIKTEPKEEKKFLDITSDAPTSENKQPQIIVQEPAKKEQSVAAEESKAAISDTTLAKPVSKNNCSAVADEIDFFKLRKRMAAIEGDDDMIGDARIYFKTKCFTVAQIKNLGTLFLNDAGKYKFFDVAYSYVADTGNFSSLQSELKDEYYINRFKAMLH